MASRPTLPAGKGGRQPLLKSSVGALTGARAASTPPRPGSFPPRPTPQPHPKAPAPSAKRPLTSQPGAPPQKAARRAEPEPALAVVAESDDDETGLHEIVCGVYAEAGTNHGRKYFQKLRCGPGQKQVFLYYYAECDEAYRGWWFGDQIGGEQVWLHSAEDTDMPPATGWQWQDGQVRHEIRVVSATEGQEDSAAVGTAAESLPRSAPQPQGQPSSQQLPDEWEERLRRATSEVDAVEVDASQALEMASLAIDNDLGLNDDSAASALELLGAQTQPLARLQHVATAEGLLKATAPAAVREAAAALLKRARGLQAQVRAAEQRLLGVRRERALREQEAKRREQEEARGRELQEKHAAQLEEILTQASEKVEAAEEEVDRAALAAAPLEAAAEDYVDAVASQAVGETERCAKVAGTALADARRFVTGKVGEVRRLIPGAKLQVLDDLAALQTRLGEAQAKLAPCVGARQRHQQRVQVKKALDELSQQLESAEVEVEKAVVASTPLFGESAEAAKEAGKPLAAAQTAVARVGRALEAKLKALQKGDDALRGGLEELQRKLQDLQEKLKEAQRAVTDMQARALADSLEEEISAKAESIESDLQEMADAEAVFAGDDVSLAIPDIDKIGSSIQSKLTDAQGFCKRVMAQVARAPSGPMESVKGAAEELQKRVEDSRERLRQFNLNAVGFRRRQVLLEADRAVGAAEAELQKLVEAMEKLKGAEEDSEMSADSFKETLQEVASVEQGAQAAFVEAKKCIINASSQLRKLPGASQNASPEAGALQARLAAVQQETAKLRKASKDAEERFTALRQLQEVSAMLRDAEAATEEAVAASEALIQGAAAEAVASAEGLLAAAKEGLAAAAKAVALKRQSARGVMGQELHAMDAKLKQAQERLRTAASSVQRRREEIQAEELLAQVSQQVEAAEAEVEKASQAESSLMGSGGMPADEAHKALVDFEAALSTALKAVSDSRASLVKVLSEVRRLSGENSETCAKDLADLQQQVEAKGARLRELQSSVTEQRRAIQQRFSQQKVSEVEAGVQKLSSSLSEISDESSIEEVQHACEQFLLVEQETSATLVAALEVQTLLMKDAKSQGVKGLKMNADIMKTQSKLRQHQAEISQLSRDCKTRQQRAAAQQLLREVRAEVLEEAVQSAHKVAAPLLASDKAELLEDLRVQSAVVGLRSHMRELELDAESLFSKIATGESATLEELASFLSGLPASETAGAFLASLSGEQAAGALTRAAGGNAGLTAAAFRTLLRDRYSCQSRLPVTDAPAGGNEVGALEIGEVLEIVEQQESDGATCAKCLLVRNGTEGWATLQSPDGDAGVELSLSPAARVDSIVAHIEGLSARCAEVAAQVEQKVGECAASMQLQQNAALSDIKSKLLQLKMHVNLHKVKTEQLRKRVSGARDALLQQGGARKQTQPVATAQKEVGKPEPPEAPAESLLEKAIREASAAVEASEEKAKKLADAVKLEPTFLQNEEAADFLLDVKHVVERASRACTEAKAAVEQSTDAKGSSRNQVLKMRVELMKLSSRATLMEKKCRTAAGPAWAGAAA